MFDILEDKFNKDERLNSDNLKNAKKKKKQMNILNLIKIYY